MLSHFIAEWFSNLQGPEGRSRKVSFCLDIDTKETSVEKVFPLGVQWFIETRNGYHAIIPPQKLDVTHKPGQTILKGYDDIEVGYDRLVYIGRL